MMWHLGMTRDLICDVAVDENIKKARTAFFVLGRLDSLTIRDLCEMCAFPALLFSCKNWVLNQDMSSFTNNVLLGGRVRVRRSKALLTF